MVLLLLLLLLFYRFFVNSVLLCTVAGRGEEVAGCEEQSGVFQLWG